MSTFVSLRPLLEPSFISTTWPLFRAKKKCSKSKEWKTRGLHHGKSAVFFYTTHLQTCHWWYNTSDEKKFSWRRLDSYISSIYPLQSLLWSDGHSLGGGLFNWNLYDVRGLPRNKIPYIQNIHKENKCTRINNRLGNGLMYQMLSFCILMW